jgi:hypothetical protein
LTFPTVPKSAPVASKWSKAKRANQFINDTKRAAENSKATLPFLSHTESPRHRSKTKEEIAKRKERTPGTNSSKKKKGEGGGSKCMEERKSSSEKGGNKRQPNREEEELPALEKINGHEVRSLSQEPQQQRILQSRVRRMSIEEDKNSSVRSRSSVPFERRTKNNPKSNITLSEHCASPSARKKASLDLSSHSKRTLSVHSRQPAMTNAAPPRHTMTPVNSRAKITLVTPPQSAPASSKWSKVKHANQFINATLCAAEKSEVTLPFSSPSKTSAWKLREQEKGTRRVRRASDLVRSAAELPPAFQNNPLPSATQCALSQRGLEGRKKLSKERRSDILDSLNNYCAEKVLVGINKDTGKKQIVVELGERCFSY